MKACRFCGSTSSVHTVEEVDEFDGIYGVVCSTCWDLVAHIAQCLIDAQAQVDAEIGDPSDTSQHKPAASYALNRDTNLVADLTIKDIKDPIGNTSLQRVEMVIDVATQDFGSDYYEDVIVRNAVSVVMRNDDNKRIWITADVLIDNE